jgi:tetratricopeptide (TPR) repeat protein
MRRLITGFMIAALALVAGEAMGQVRGKARLQGNVTDKATGKPIKDAKVTIAISDGSTTPIVTKTNDKGRWSALGLVTGSWNIDIEAAGYETSRGAVSVSEVSMVPPIKTELAAAAPAEPEQAAVPATPGVPQEVVDAIKHGQELLAAGNAKEAIPEFEKGMAGLPDNMQLKQVLAQAYYKDGQLPKAIALLETVTAAEPANTAVALVLTNIYLENGQLDEGKARLAALPAGAVTDPTVYVNIGILFLNKNNPAEAVTYFTKATELDGTRHEAFYYRGLAELQQKKMKEAKADFEKVLALAPDSSEAKDSKQLIDSLK